MELNKNKIMLFATWGNVGNKFIVPGTFGTFFGFPLYFLVSLFDASYAFLFILAFILFSVFIAEEAEKNVGEKDPGCIVIDEVAGALVTFAFVPFTFTSFWAGFFIFRFFDITKIYPIKALEQRIPGGAGIVLDDIAAGIMSNIVLRCFLLCV